MRISGGEVDADRITTIIGYGKRLLDRPVELIDGVEEVLDALGHHRLMVITKGDVHDQLAKVAASGLAERFWRVEVVADKHVDVYGELLERHRIDPGPVRDGWQLPALRRGCRCWELGGIAVHVPYPITWRHEDDHDGHHVDVPTLEALRDLPQLLRGWDGDGDGELGPGLAGPAGMGGRYGAHPA